MKSGKWATKANFDKDGDCSGVYITSKNIPLQGMAPIPNRTVVYIKDTKEADIEISTVAASSVKFKLNRDTANSFFNESEQANEEFDKCFNANKALEDKHAKHVRACRIRELIVLLIMLATLAYSVVQLVNAIKSPSVVKIITAILLVSIAGALTIATIALRAKKKSLWFHKVIEYSEFTTTNKTRENFNEMLEHFSEMGFIVHENTKG